MYDRRLEEISDKIRKGEPVGMFEALDAINYQETLKKERQSQKFRVTVFFEKLLAWFSK